jgi:excisionase family DNA binding protein
MATNTTTNTMKTARMDGGAEPRVGERLLYTIGDVSQLLGGIARSYVYELLARGALSSIKLGRRRLIARQDLEEYVERLREGAA